MELTQQEINRCYDWYEKFMGTATAKNAKEEDHKLAQKLFDNGHSKKQTEDCYTTKAKAYIEILEYLRNKGFVQVHIAEIVSNIKL